MSHTYWDPKGMVKKRPGGYTYYGGNTRLSDLYKERYLPHYDKNTKMTNTEPDDDDETVKLTKNWNTFQKRTWYQDNMDRVRSEFSEFPGTHAEWKKAGEFDKSYRKYNSEIVHDFHVDVKTIDANGVESTRQMRTTDHTEVQKLKRLIDEKDRYDIPGGDEIDKVILGRDNSNSSNNEIKFFDVKSPTRPNTTPGRIREKHPAVNPKLCSENPKDTFRTKYPKQLFGFPSRK